MLHLKNMPTEDYDQQTILRIIFLMSSSGTRFGQHFQDSSRRSRLFVTAPTSREERTITTDHHDDCRRRQLEIQARHSC